MGCGASTHQSSINAQIHQNDSAYQNQQADAAASALGQNQGLSSRLHMSIKLNGLKKMDTFSKSDPMCVVKMRSGEKPVWSEIGRTEIIVNSQNPDFVTQIKIAYHFEERQYVRFEVYDIDSQSLESNTSTLDLSAQDFQGSVESLLGQILGVGGHGTWNAPLEGNEGQIHVCFEEVINCNALINLQICAEQVVSKDLIGQSDPFVMISRLNEDGSWTACYKTETKMNTKQPRWNVIQSSVQQLANGDVYRPLQFECFDYDKNGSHDLIGKCQASIAEIQTFLKQADEENAYTMPLIDPQKRSSDGYTSSGKLCFEKCELKHHPSFLDFIHAGSEMSFIVAIDYTASNGDPQVPGTLHYLDPTGNQLNQYAQAILGIGSVIEFYDTDKKFPTFGFGGKLGEGEQVSHCFAVNGNPAEPDLHPQPGIGGILQTYYNSINQVQFAGPTLFAPVISQAVALAQSTSNSGKYYVLLILTDGVIHDMPLTVESIISGCDVPLSILIVGVGGADFSAMEELDGDSKTLKSQSGRQASRDIVQFVKLSDFMNGPYCDKLRLAKQLLAEIPVQFLSFMRSAGITPDSIKNHTSEVS
mmetsp:Transcript_19842/g.25653  ORF Transcript_19842/g.25653 Transcript_19842/m.25653 type:complete len:588 (+) Transcript_19842:125-1888(+)